ncbi:MAG: transglycosylase SLT domain-containing protein [Paludibacteraceae bacterium]|nr:transglycosylase SLT domain-containing protein [Paludibacteraceae bacterium]
MKKAAIILFLVAVLSFLLGFMRVEVSEGEEEITREEMVPFQSCFEQCAPEVGWDWPLLASVAYHESRFHAKAHSQSGACGVMQLMPKTARRFGLNDSTIWVPEDNIRAGVKYIQFLQGKWAFIHNQDEQTKFVLASYNVGPGFIFAARKLAKADGANPYVWSQVEPYVSSSYPRRYVKQVLKTANKYRNDYTEWETNSR